MGLANSKHINRIVIDPTNNNIVLVAATGPLFGPGGDRGVYKTTDGGTTWKQVLKVDDDTGANDLVHGADRSEDLYASTYQRRRTACCMNGGGPGSGIWKSTDGGDTWTRLTNGLPTGPLGRIGARRLSAQREHRLRDRSKAEGRARAADAAAAARRRRRGAAAARRRTWRRRGGWRLAPTRAAPASIDRTTAARRGGSVSRRIRGRCTSARCASIRTTRIACSWRRRPADVDRRRPHVRQAAAISRARRQARHLDRSGQLGSRPDRQRRRRRIVVRQSEDVDVPAEPAGRALLPRRLRHGDAVQRLRRHAGQLQLVRPSASRHSRGITNDDWFQVQGGDGFVAITDPRDSRIVYTESQDGNMTREEQGHGRVEEHPPDARERRRRAEAGRRVPLPLGHADRASRRTIRACCIVGGNNVFRSTDRGDSWTAISPDLTTNAESRRRSS